jgi:hypothetical protein
MHFKVNTNMPPVFSHFINPLSGVHPPMRSGYFPSVSSTHLEKYYL